MSSKTVEERYKKLSQTEHILHRPDTYIGSRENATQEAYVYDSSIKKIVRKTIKFPPGLFKIFDEILVNAADNKQRDPKGMKNMRVVIDRNSGSISIENDGNSIPIEIHKEYKIFVSELLFGELLTSDNYDDTEKRVTGGRNGFGAKLTNIFSTSFKVETCDGKQFLECRWENNMSVKHKPVKTAAPAGSKSFTRVTFVPDWDKFDMQDGMTEDVEGLFVRRVYDMVATCEGCSIYYNGTKLELKGFKEYASLYLPEKQEDEKSAPVDNFISLTLDGRFQVLIGECRRDFPQQVSFANSIFTAKGGTHVDYILKQIVDALVKKHKDWRPMQIKAAISIFVTCLVENPTFDSQIKENLTLKPAQFGCSPVISDKDMKKILSCGIEDAIKTSTTNSIDRELARKMNTSTANVARLNIPKLDDANLAGTARWRECTLILTEGDSAKTSCLAGVSIVGRDKYGVFPLRGKLLNVREASSAQITANQEIKNLMAILGIGLGKETNRMRYGSVMIMTDQDPDGSHIKGLIVNLFHCYWPHLLRQPGFLKQFVTPLVKVKKGKTEIQFFSQPQYEKWKEENNNGKGWNIRYYKGLGTSDDREFKEYFLQLAKHKIDFSYTGSNDDEKIQMAFSKSAVEARKRWIESYNEGTFFDCTQSRVTYTDFIDKELIIFSRYDVVRSVPSLVDGFKPGQRKVMFGAFKRNLKTEIKVAQFAAYVAEHSCYHHAEHSLSTTVISMAQTFVGANNINVLCPVGQFGSRKEGGKDASAARYIFTRLSNITRVMFPQSDDPLLEYQNEEGTIIEPKWYCPVIPLVLVNGTDGIGTGWSSSVPNYNPKDIILNMKRVLRGLPYQEMTPWYRGFTGDIRKREGSGYETVGRYEWLDATHLAITELPVKVWTQGYKEFLDSMLPGATEQQAKLAVSSKAGAKVKAKAKAKKTAVVKTKAKAKAKKRPSSDENVDSDEEEEDHEEQEVPVAAPEKRQLVIEHYLDNSSNSEVSFTVTVSPQMRAEFLANNAMIEKNLKLKSSVATTNMTLFNADGKIYRFATEKDILFEFMAIRIEKYKARKESLLANLSLDIGILGNKHRFITEIVQGKLVVSNRKRKDLLEELLQRGYQRMSVMKNKFKAPEVPKGELELISEKNEMDGSSENIEETSTVSSSDFEYLLGMPIWSLTKERADSLKSDLDKKEESHADIARTPVEVMWDRDLDAVLEEFLKIEEDDRALLEMDRGSSRQTAALLKKAGGTKVLVGSPGGNKGKKKAKSRTTKKKSLIDSDEDEDFIDDESDDDFDLGVYANTIEEASPHIDSSLRKNAISKDEALRRTLSKLDPAFADVLKVEFKPFTSYELPSSKPQVDLKLEKVSQQISKMAMADLQSGEVVKRERKIKSDADGVEKTTKRKVKTEADGDEKPATKRAKKEIIKEESTVDSSDIEVSGDGVDSLASLQRRFDADPSSLSLKERMRLRTGDTRPTAPSSFDLDLDEKAPKKATAAAKKQSVKETVKKEPTDKKRGKAFVSDFSDDDDSEEDDQEDSDMLVESDEDFYSEEEEEDEEVEDSPVPATKRIAAKSAFDSDDDAEVTLSAFGSRRAGNKPVTPPRKAAVRSTTTLDLDSDDSLDLDMLDSPANSPPPKKKAAAAAPKAASSKAKVKAKAASKKREVLDDSDGETEDDSDVTAENDEDYDSCYDSPSPAPKKSKSRVKRTAVDSDSDY